MVTIFLGVLAVAWICVGGQVVLQRRREGRADSTVSSFRAQLSTLERATPGTVMRHSLTGPVPMVKVDAVPARPAMTPLQRRRRDVLVGLLATFSVTTLMALVTRGAGAITLMVLSGAALGAYVWALRQLRLRTLGRAGASSYSAHAEPSTDGATITVLSGHRESTGSVEPLRQRLAN